MLCTGGKKIKLENIPKFNKPMAFNKAVGCKARKKNTKLINVGPTFIPDNRVFISLT